MWDSSRLSRVVWCYQPSGNSLAVAVPRSGKCFRSLVLPVPRSLLDMWEPVGSVMTFGVAKEFVHWYMDRAQYDKYFEIVDTSARRDSATNVLWKREPEDNDLPRDLVIRATGQLRRSSRPRGNGGATLPDRPC